MAAPATAAVDAPARSSEVATLAAPADRIQLADTPATAAPAARDFSVNISGPDQAQATLRIREMGGELKVSVHTPDAALSRTLRSDLDSLNTRLETAGVKAQVWSPAQSAPASDSRGGGDSPGDRSGARDTTARQNPGQTDPDRQQRRSRWAEEMEKQYDG